MMILETKLLLALLLMISVVVVVGWIWWMELEQESLNLKFLLANSLINDSKGPQQDDSYSTSLRSLIEAGKGGQHKGANQLH
ncbi:hypothetical protein L2725_06985 [Shewanella corallii]|uniref:Two-component sensor histidine kinase n=1 Tax=Shewanella corallii TaxID=560080 RepID=A0ABT0N560_9GAMM|nr:hypothetical protein [Shewanella corallii]MCL2913532.1 hypothetical protein [Shewanella corallii]